MKTLLPTERSLNRCIYPIRKNKNIEFPIKILDHNDNKLFECNGFFTNRHFLMVDLITHFCLKKLYIQNDEIIPHSCYQNEVINHNKILVSPQDIYNLAKSYDDNSESSNKLNLTINLKESNIRALPTFEKYSSNRIFTIINDISNFNFKTNYQVRFYIKEDKKFKHFKLDNKDTNIPHKLFNFELIEKRNKNDDIYNREYLINFNTFFGNLFLLNLLTINIDFYDYEKFCKLSECSQFVYRFINTKKNGHLQNDFILNELLHKLNYKYDINIGNYIAYLKNSFEELKTESFIKDFEFKNHIDGKKITVYFYNEKDKIS